MAIEGVCIALDDATLEADPAWVRIDTDYQVQSYSWDVGRAYEFDHTEAGTGQILLVDINGDFDPTNTGSPLYGRLEPLKQAALALQNPVTTTWSTRFRGFIESILWEPFQNEQIANVTISLVDGLALVASAELVGGMGTGVPTYEGDIVYEEDTGLDAVQTRINAVLDDVGWPAGLRQIFTGNVKLQSKVYAPRTSAIVPIMDAADSEFPGVANVYVNSAGEFTFHGRFARFDPVSVSSTTDWDYTEWSCGDDAAVLGNEATVVKVSPPLSVYRDVEHIYTTALCLPYGVADADIDGQYVASGAVSAYGIRTWSAENLLTLGGDGTTALEETLAMANYYMSNYATPRTRVGRLTFRPHMPGDTRAAATWALLCGVDISDSITLTTTHGGGGGFNESFYVEGVSGEVRPMNAAIPEVTLTLDVSPTSYYDVNTF